MSRYIDIENFCENFCHCNNEYCDKSNCPILNAPTADVAEVKRGEWTKDDSDGCFCSFCGWYTDYDYDYVINNGLGNDDFIYCSHCGARMDGGEE